MSSVESSECDGDQIPEDPCWPVLWHPGTFGLLLHSAQGSQGGRRYGHERPQPFAPWRLTPTAAYTIYAFFEWALILFDVGFDAVTALDFEALELVVKDVKGVSRRYVQRLPK